MKYKNATVLVSMGDEIKSLPFEMPDKSSVTAKDLIKLLQGKDASQVISDWHSGIVKRLRAKTREKILKNFFNKEKDKIHA